MTGKMDWRRAAQRDAQRRPKDSPGDPTLQRVKGAWGAILEAMAERRRAAKAKDRKAVPHVARGADETSG